MRRIVHSLSALPRAAKLLGGAFAMAIGIVVLVALVLQPLAPPVAAAGPLAGAKGVAPTTPVSLSFDKPMDQAAVQRAFRVVPETPGDFQWQGNTVRYLPRDGWARKATYRVSLDTAAASIFGRQLAEPLAFSFTTADKFAVATVQPAAGTPDSPVDSTLLVQFTRPVVALGTREQPAAPLDLAITPAAPGSGKWLTTSVYIYRPEGGLRPSTRYTVTVPAGTKDVNGESLPADFAWSFTTPLAAVGAVTPADNSRYADPAGAVKVVFNQPMAPGAAASFALATAGGEPVAGDAAWSDEKTLLFRPAQPLALATAYTAKVRAGALAAGSNAGTERDFAWTFTTSGVPRVLSTTPADGQQQQVSDPRVLIRFSYPMDRDSTAAALSIVPTATQVYSGWQDSDTTLALWGNFQPSTRYEIRLAATAQSRDGLRLEQSFRFSFTMSPREPFLRFVGADYGPVGTFNAYLPSEITVDYVNVSRIDYALYRLDQDTFRRLAADYRSFESYAPPTGNLVRRWSSGPLAGERDKSQFARVSLAEGTPLAPGLYYLEARADRAAFRPKMLLVASRVGLTLKRGGGQGLVWAVDLKSGEPLRDRGITLIDREGKVTAQGRTDGNGLFLGAAPDLWSSARPGEPQTVFAVTGGGDDFGLVASTWSAGREVYGGDVYVSPSIGQWNGYVYTDRPIYRPGQKVYYQGFLRRDDDVRFSLPDPGMAVAVTVRDPQGKELLSQQVKLSDLGGFDGALALADQAAVGGYFVDVRAGDQHFGTPFMVAEYRKPEFEVQVGTDRREYVEGDQVAVTVKASYYFGAPVAGAKVRWRVLGRDHVFTWPEGYYEFVDSDLLRGHDPMGLRGEGSAVTDARGEATFRVPVSLSKDPLSQVFTIEASVSDASYQEVSARSAVIAHKGELYLGLRPARYVGAAGQPQSVELVSVSKEGQAIGGVPTELTFYSRQWFSVQEKQRDGTVLWTSKFEDTLLGRQTATTGDKGQTTATFVPEKGGVHRVVAVARDARGNELRSATTLYVASPEYAPWRVENNDRVELVPDKKEYQVGETARVLVAAPFGNTLALVTAERGRIIDYRLTRLGSNSAVLEIPITADHIPNVYVGVVLSKGPEAAGQLPQVKVGYARLGVSAASKRLDVAITTDRPRYAPGEEVSYRIKTTDAAGKGVPAELSFALVDAAVLALADDPSGDPHAAFYGPRPLGVQTAAALAMSIDRVNRDLSRSEKGVGDGREGPSDTRSYFPDTAYWNAALRTDANGEATVTVKLPDSLTTWRARVKGFTRETLVGGADRDVVATKDLLLRPVAPRFFVAGDEAQLQAIVHNYTEAPLEVDVSLAAGGLAPVEGAGFASQRVTLAPKGLQKVQWRAKVDLAARQSVLTFRAAPLGGGIPGDAVELTLPVRPPATAEVTASSGEVRGSTTELVRLGAEVSRELGELTIDASPSLAAGLRYPVAYLDEFPYECTEQTVSRFLPRIVMQRAFDLLGLPDKEGIAPRLPDIVARGIQRLYKEQHYDGGWGWWVSDESDPWITGYALFGLAEARRSGHTVDEGVMNRAAQYLRGYLNRPPDAAVPEDANRRAFVLFALAAAGRGDLGLTNAAFERRSTLGSYGKAFLALALNNLNEPAADERAKTLVAELGGEAILSASAAHWEEDGTDYRTMNTNTRSTAVVLNALVKLAPDSPLVPNAVRWLMVARKEGRWETTQETAWSLLALTDYLATSGDLSGDYSYQVSVNGRPLGGGVVSAGSLEETKRLQVALKDLLAGADNKVVVARQREGGQTGAGNLYYTLGLRYFVPSEQVEPAGEGVAVMREYQRQGDGAAVDTVGAGDLIKVKLTLAVPEDMHYFILEDPLPAGAEAVDTRLKTTSVTVEQEQALKEKAREGLAGPAKPEPRKEERRWYFGQPEVRDDRVALFATYLPKGTYEYTYLIRATTPGVYQALPARAYEMYFPEVWGRSAGNKLTVRAE